MEKRSAIYSVFVMIIVFFSVILLNNVSGKSEISFNFPISMKVANSNSVKEVTETQNVEIISDNIDEKEIKKVEDFSNIEFNRILYPGMGGDDVKKAQYLLNKAGYYKGEIDGYFDDGTKRAVILFQKDRNIMQTGNIGDMTQTSLNQIN